MPAARVNCCRGQEAVAAKISEDKEVVEDPKIGDQIKMRIKMPAVRIAQGLFIFFFIVYKISVQFYGTYYYNFHVDNINRTQH